MPRSQAPGAGAGSTCASAPSAATWAAAIPARPRQGPLPRERHPVIKSLPLRTGGLHVVLHLPALSLRPNAERGACGHDVELPYEGVAAAAERTTQRMA